jgi:hypothetical protein
MKSKKNILRFDYPETGYKGWRLSVTRAGTDLVKYFSDREFGGMKKAYAQADKARVRLEKILKDVPARVAVTTKPAAKGIRGVHRAKTIGRKGDRQRPAWVATWTEKSRRRTRKFPVDKHGETGAKSLAVKARKAAEKSQGLLRSKSEIRSKLTEAQRFLDSLD